MTPQEMQSALEAIIYAADEPATIGQLAEAVGGDKVEVRAALDLLVAAYQTDDRGIEIRKVAGGWKLYTKPQHHDVVRKFIKSLRPPVRLTMPALETLAVVAYKQPVTAPGDQRNSRGELRRRVEDSARKAFDHYGGTQSRDRAADSVSHFERFPDALWALGSGRAAELEGIRAIGAGGAGRGRGNRADRAGAGRNSRRKAERRTCGRWRNKWRRIARLDAIARTSSRRSAARLGRTRGCHPG